MQRKRDRLYSVHVGNLPKTITKKELLTLFNGCGNVVEIHLQSVKPSDTFTFGFVRYATQMEARKAVEDMDKWPMHSKPMSVAWAKDQPNHRSVPGSATDGGSSSQVVTPSERQQNDAKYWMHLRSVASKHNREKKRKGERPLELKSLMKEALRYEALILRPITHVGTPVILANNLLQDTTVRKRSESDITNEPLMSQATDASNPNSLSSSSGTDTSREMPTSKSQQYLPDPNHVSFDKDLQSSEELRNITGEMKLSNQQYLPDPNPVSFDEDLQRSAECRDVKGESESLNYDFPVISPKRDDNTMDSSYDFMDQNSVSQKEDKTSADTNDTSDDTPYYANDTIASISEPFDTDSDSEAQDKSPLFPEKHINIEVNCNEEERNSLLECIESPRKNFSTDVHEDFVPNVAPVSMDLGKSRNSSIEKPPHDLDSDGATYKKDTDSLNYGQQNQVVQPLRKFKLKLNTKNLDYSDSDSDDLNSPTESSSTDFDEYLKDHPVMSTSKPPSLKHSQQSKDVTTGVGPLGIITSPKGESPKGTKVKTQPRESPMMNSPSVYSKESLSKQLENRDNKSSINKSMEEPVSHRSSNQESGTIGSSNHKTGVIGSPNHEAIQTLQTPPRPSGDNPGTDILEILDRSPLSRALKKKKARQMEENLYIP